MATILLLVLLLLWVRAQPQSSPDLPPQVAQGQKVYLAHCALCHGQKGEGGGAHPLVGPGKLRGYQNAFNLYNYTKLTMPFDKPQSLKDEEYWAVVAYMLHANNLLPKDFVLNADNARALNLLPAR
jgi:cytochrome c